MKPPHSFFPSIFLPGVAHEDSNGASSLSLFVLLSSPVFSMQSFDGDHILFFISNVSSCRCSSYSFISRYSIIPECSRYLEDLCLHSAFIQALSRMSPHSSHLIQPVQSLFSSNHSTVFSFEWALTHRSFPRILPDSSYFPGSIPKVFPSLT